MACLLLESFGYYSTAQLPALWDTASDVVIDQTGGPLLSGAALMDASQPSALTKALTWGDGTTYLGFRVKFSALQTTVTLATLVTTLATIRLQLASTGVLFVTVNEVVQPGVSPPNQITVAGGGAYVELKIDLAGGVDSIDMRVNEQRVASSALSPLGDSFVSVTLGGGSLAPEVGSWLLCDVYLLDGVPVAPFQQGLKTIDNASFLGNTRVQAVFATQEGLKTTPPPPPFDPPPDPSYTSWVPTPGPHHFDMVNEHPPDGGTTRESSTDIGLYVANQLNTYATYGFVHPFAGAKGFGLQPVSLVPWSIFALQWIGHLATNGVNTVKGTFRDPVDLPTTDTVAISAALSLLSAVYGYQAVLADRDPVDVIEAADATEWSFADVFLQEGVDAPGREFGITLSS